MKKCKTALLLAVTVLLFSMTLLSSCGEPIPEINVTLIIEADGEELLDKVYTLKLETPTVLSLVQQAVIDDEIQITLNPNEDSIQDMQGYKERTEGTVSYFWEFIVNDVLLDNQTGGKAKDYVIKDGDVIKYVYSAYDASATGNR
jgi:hypothetical protein